MNLSGKKALVTGSGRGIGYAIAMKLAELGADVAVNDIGDPAPLEKVAEEIRGLGRQSLAIIADVSSADDVGSMVEQVTGTFGRLDILVNNAGVTRDGLAMRMSEADWDTVLDIDLKSAFLCTKAALRPMIKQRYGRIISIASIIGIIGNAGQANYAAAKAGVMALTRSVAKEVGSRGITVNAIAPGYIETQMTQVMDDKHQDEMLKLVPAGRRGTPQDVAEAVAFLASDAAAYITAHVLNVDGGLAPH